MCECYNNYYTEIVLQLTHQVLPRVCNLRNTVLKSRRISQNEEHDIETEKVSAACRRTPEQHQARLEGDRLRSRRRRTLETPDDRAGRLEADRMRVSSRQRALNRDPSASRDKTGSREK